MSKGAHSFCMVVLLVFIASSCIKDTLPECPPQLVVKLVIKDSNYFNIAQFSELSPEDSSQPFAHFSGTICYILTNTTTGQIVRQSDIIVPVGNTPDFSLSFNDLPEGKYELSVWGNITKDIPLGILHQNGLEHTDIYTGYTRLVILSQNQEQTLELERTKGKLVIFCRNFPTEVAQMSLTLSPVYQSTDALLNYQGSANIQKTTGTQAINETFVAPTPQGNSTKLDLNFFTNSRAATPVLTVPPMDITIRRNEISAVAVDYDAPGNAWEIWTFINGEWNMIHHLDIK